MDSCSLCDVAAGRTTANVVYEDETTLAFTDIRFESPAHIAVIPKGHVGSLAETNETTRTHVFAIAMRMIRAIRKSSLGCNEVSIVYMDNGESDHGRSHALIQLMPRFDYDPTQSFANWMLPPPQEKWSLVAQMIRDADAVHEGRDT